MRLTSDSASGKVLSPMCATLTLMRELWLATQDTTWHREGMSVVKEVVDVIPELKIRKWRHILMLNKDELSMKFLTALNQKSP